MKFTWKNIYSDRFYTAYDTLSSKVFLVDTLNNLFIPIMNGHSEIVEKMDWLTNHKDRIEVISKYFDWKLEYLEYKLTINLNGNYYDFNNKLKSYENIYKNY